MLEVKNVKTFNWEGALRGMRNPMNSWDKSDSRYDKSYKYYNDKELKENEINLNNEKIEIGSNDYELCWKLIIGGSEHRKFLRQIFVSLDITAPEYFFKEYETYQIGTTENSTSTMHKIMSKPFDGSMFSVDDKDDRLFQQILHILNHYWEIYHEAKNNNNTQKMYCAWRKIIQYLPMSYLYTRTCTMNYEVLLNMYKQRKNHKLSEWKDLFDQLKQQLPYPEFFTLEK